MSEELNPVEDRVLKYAFDHIGNAIAEQNVSAHELLNEEDLSGELRAAVAKHKRLNQEHQELTKESVSLLAKRMEVKHTSDQLTLELQEAQRCHEQWKLEIKRREHESCTRITEYEDTLREIADRFRKTSMFCDIDLMRKKIEQAKLEAVAAEAEAQALQSSAAALEAELCGLAADWPHDILDIVGKSELEQRLRQLTEECEELQKNIT